MKNILAKYNFQKRKNKLIFSLDLKNNTNSVSDLFKDLIKNSITFYDVEIKKNNLEEIFLKLIDVNIKGIIAIYKYEMSRTYRTFGQSIASPVLSTALYFIVFGTAIGSRIGDIDGVSYSSFIVQV